jgi:hypothetical protein
MMKLKINKTSIKEPKLKIKNKKNKTEVEILITKRANL